MNRYSTSESSEIEATSPLPHRAEGLRGLFSPLFRGFEPSDGGGKGVEQETPYTLADVEMLLEKLIQLEDYDDTKVISRAKHHILYLLREIGLPEPLPRGPVIKRRENN